MTRKRDMASTIGQTGEYSLDGGIQVNSMEQASIRRMNNLKSNLEYGKWGKDLLGLIVVRLD